MEKKNYFSFLTSILNRIFNPNNENTLLCYREGPSLSRQKFYLYYFKN